MKKILLALPEPLLAALTERASLAGISRSKYIRQALTLLVEKPDRPVVRVTGTFPPAILDDLEGAGYEVIEE